MYALTAVCAATAQKMFSVVYCCLLTGYGCSCRRYHGMKVTQAIAKILIAIVEVRASKEYGFVWNCFVILCNIFVRCF